MSAAKGRYIKWDWKQQKYIWSSKEEERAQLNKDQVPTPSPYLQKLKPNRQSVQSVSRVPPKRACKRPLKVYKKEVKYTSKSKKNKVAKSRVPPSTVISVRKGAPVKPKAKARSSISSQKRQRVIKPSRNMADGDQGYKRGHDEADVALPPQELLQGHDTFMTVMTNRLIHQGAALTFWRQSPDALVSYLIRTNDDAVTVDVLPTLTKSFKSETATNNQISMGACLDIIPVLRRLLDSKFEDYIKASLDFLRTMIRFYWKELLAMKASANNVTNLQRSQSLFGIYTSLVAMTDKLNKLAKRKDSVGEKAIIVADLIKKL